MAAHLSELDQAFLWLLRADAQLTAVVIAVLLARRALGHRISPGARYALWLLLALPLLAPLLPNSPVRLPRAARRHPPEVTQPGVPSWAVTAVTDWRVVYDSAAPPAPPTSAGAPRSTNWLRLAACTWLAGAALLGLRVAITHTLAIRLAGRAPAVTDATLVAQLEDCRHAVRTRLRPALVAAPDGRGPALLGILRPRLLFPAGLLRRLSPDELRFVFLHELIHLKRGDVPAEWLLALLQVAHWFNPLVWVAASRCRADREIACDAAVLALTDGARRADYGRTILRLATELSAPRQLASRFARTLAPAVGILETHWPLERRLRMIAQDSHPRPARWAAAAVVVLALAAVTCTNAQPRAQKQPPIVAQAPAGEGAKPQTAAPEKEPDAGAARSKTVSAAEVQRQRQEDEVRARQKLLKNQQAEAQLDRQLPEINFNNVGLKDVIDFLRDVSGANIFVNWKALNAAGIERTSAVSARLRDIPLRKALAVLLDSAGGAVKLGFTVDDGVITVSTDEDLHRDTVTRVYDVRDLLVRVPNFDFDPAHPNEGADKEKEDKARDDAGVTRAQAAEELMRLIRDTVEPERWGKVAAMRELQGQLIVTATKPMHETIAQLVDQLRDTRALQISVEARFIGADDDVLDGLPDALRKKVAGALHASKAGAPAPAGKAATAPAKGAADKALIQYLDDDEVEALLRVVRANRNAEFLTAPRITLFNGQTAYVLTATQRAYVADYKTVKAPDGKTTYEPTLATAEAGVLLRAGATAGAERKTASLTLRPRLTYLAGIQDVPWHGNPPGEELKVQVPQLLVSELGTTFSIPDRGTALLGGLHGYVAADPDNPKKEPRVQNVIMLVKPTIIAQREVQDPQFPLLPPRKREGQ